MNNEEQQLLEQLATQVQREQNLRMQAENKISEMSGYSAGKEPNIVQYQLDVSPTLDREYHLLSGHILITHSDGNEEWVEPKDDRLKILSPYGVKQIINLMSRYISPDMLLSNLKEEQIYNITKVFGEELADLLYCRYEYFFYAPSPEELFEKYKPLVSNHKLDINDKELYMMCVKWSREELLMKTRHYPMLIHSLTHKVFVNLLRALNGKERDSLRKQYNVHQNLSNPNDMGLATPQKRGLFGGVFK